MDRDKQRSLLDRPFGYHIENHRFLKWLNGIALEDGVSFVSGNVTAVNLTESDDIESINLENGTEISADLFVDCSGFDSFLLGKALKQPFFDFGNALYCDSAIVGMYQRDGTILPYTTAATMNHGWCWQIDLPDHVTVGYVHSTRFCEPEEVTQELRRARPELGNDLRVIRFPSGRYENFWVNNVVAIGNASGFVEPLESTALHMIAEQLLSVCGALLDSDYRIQPAAREIENVRFRRRWDAIRDFLALHYKFNNRLNTPFWRHCREHTDLGAAQQVADIYTQLGPHKACEELLPHDTLVQFEGYLSLLIGQRVPTCFNSVFDDTDLRDWENYQGMIRQQVSRALSAREALDVVHSESWRWS